MTDINENKTDRAFKLADDALADLNGGYVIINNSGCYELYRDDGTYEWTFRGDQLDQLRKYAKKHGISYEIIDPDELPESR